MIEKGEDVRGEVEELGVVERACETAVLNLRRIKGVNLKEFSVKTGLDFMELFAEPVKKYSREGLMKVTKNGVCLSRNALGVADGILCDFAAV
jgi:coproporphyrinogen III oxidase-like Fe-S oxidoreductase